MAEAVSPAHRLEDGGIKLEDTNQDVRQLDDRGRLDAMVKAALGEQATVGGTEGGVEEECTGVRNVHGGPHTTSHLEAADQHGAGDLHGGVIGVSAFQHQHDMSSDFVDNRGNIQHAGVATDLATLQQQMAALEQHLPLRQMRHPSLEEQLRHDSSGALPTTGTTAADTGGEEEDDDVAMGADRAASKGSGGNTNAAGMQQSSDGKRCKLPRPEVNESCPRCQSADTKFCYYNNYNIKQPRFFCKACQRYWTSGGTLRNVPPGSGRRKSKVTLKDGSDKDLSGDGKGLVGGGSYGPSSALAAYAANVPGLMNDNLLAQYSQTAAAVAAATNAQQQQQQALISSLQASGQWPTSAASAEALLAAGGRGGNNAALYAAAEAAAAARIEEPGGDGRRTRAKLDPSAAAGSQESLFAQLGLAALAGGTGALNNFLATMASQHGGGAAGGGSSLDALQGGQGEWLKLAAASQQQQQLAAVQQAASGQQVSAGSNPWAGQAGAGGYGWNQWPYSNYTNNAAANYMAAAAAAAYNGTRANTSAQQSWNALSDAAAAFNTGTPTGASGAAPGGNSTANLSSNAAAMMAQQLMAQQSQQLQQHQQQQSQQQQQQQQQHMALQQGAGNGWAGGNGGGGWNGSGADGQGWSSGGGNGGAQASYASMQMGGGGNGAAAAAAAMLAKAGGLSNSGGGGGTRGGQYPGSFQL